MIMPQKKYLSVFIKLIIVLLLAILLIRKNMKMDYVVELSPLPQNELWTEEYAEEMLEKAYMIGIPYIKDKNVLLELVKQAYQWDKYAMIQYIKITRNQYEIEPDPEHSLELFIKSHKNQLVDIYGHQLTKPAILDLHEFDFMRVLADHGYLYPILYVIYFDHTLEHNKRITYMRNVVKQNEAYHLILAHSILFNQRSGYKKNTKFSDIIKPLPEFIPTLINSELTEAISYFEQSAKHGDLYCLVRLVEAYFYGIGKNKNLKKALAWSELVNQAYSNYKTSTRMESNPQDNKDNDELYHYNQTLVQQIKQHLTPEDIKHSEIELTAIQQNIKWDYDKWIKSFPSPPPQP